MPWDPSKSSAVAPAVSPGNRSDEFPPGAAEWPAGLDRRTFVRLMGASIALAGLNSCARSSLDRIVPRTTSPESTARAPGETILFASVMPCEGFARGILVTAQDGRPTKIEGNPDHPESLGATDVFTQAAILSLYDPDRSAAPRRHGQPSSWPEFEAAWATARVSLLADQGAGLVLLTEPTTSPTVRREIHALLDAFPAARWFQHTPLGRYDHRGTQADFAWENADVILTLESDCLYEHPAAVRYGRGLAARRRLTHGRSAAPRFHAIESSPSVTGTLADFRLPASPGRMRAVLNAVADALEGRNEPSGLLPPERNFVRALAADMKRHSGRIACIAGAECDASVRDWAAACNRRFGSDVVSLLPSFRSDSDSRSAGTLTDLATALDAGGVTAVCVLGTNPVYTSPAALDLATRLQRVPLVVHLGEYADETAAVAHWHLPESHFLETWSDLRAYSGAASIQQPVITPLHDSRSLPEVLRQLRGAPAMGAYDVVRETWQRQWADEFELHWNRGLARGTLDEPTAAAPVPPEAAAFPPLDAAEDDTAVTLVFRADPNVLDGRFANNAWLQELPKPLTHLVWENAALVSVAFAAERGLANGDILACTAGGRTLEAPVWIMPGQAAHVVTLFLGYGRTHAGSVGSGLGYNAWQVRPAADAWHCDAILRPAGRPRRNLVSTQGHFALEGRDLVRVLSPAAAAQAHVSAPLPSLYPPAKPGAYAWGMSIDLGTCLGCNACIIACQAENNIPVVGREQVARGREMHWIRVDRYVSGDPASPRFLVQPVPCMQCENAPCEVVCPVAATVHSSEGLNDMVYNRCVGTRYCSNNCPYKVRRFNFFDYRAARSSPLHLQENPHVTVRERGVMEKCTYCVQRINAARSRAETEHRAIRDGEIRTACEQACPAEAIVFGDLYDPSSRVSRRKAEAIDYALLEELNTRPRTTYLAAVRHLDFA